MLNVCSFQSINSKFVTTYIKYENIKKSIDNKKNKYYNYTCVKNEYNTICGYYSKEDTPVPIPNTEVKLFSADGTWWATAWESKT